MLFRSGKPVEEGAESSAPAAKAAEGGEGTPAEGGERPANRNRRRRRRSSGAGNSGATATAETPSA